MPCGHLAAFPPAGHHAEHRDVAQGPSLGARELSAPCSGDSWMLLSVSPSSCLSEGQIVNTESSCAM